MDDFTHVLVLKQSTFVMLPVYVNDSRFVHKGLQVTEEIMKVLSRQKCVVGLVIAGISGLVVMVIIMWLHQCGQ